MVKLLKRGVLLFLIFVATSCLDDSGISPIEQWNKDVAIIDNYLISNNIDAIRDASGIRIAILQLGEGLPPNSDNELKVHYTGKLLSNGSIFDSGTVTNKLSSYIAGWQIGLTMLPEGSKATLYIPSGYAYGTNGTSGIPGNANLVFDVEIESVSLTPQQQLRLSQDIATIEDYLYQNEIEAIEHESGIRYVITEEALGEFSPTLYEQVRLGLKGTVLSTGTVFMDEIVEPRADFSSRVVNFPHGVLIALQLMKEGDKATLYVPSTLAYGTRSYSNLPANSIVIFEVHLIEIL